jgi:hypothetical protein
MSLVQSFVLAPHMKCTQHTPALLRPSFHCKLQHKCAHSPHIICCSACHYRVAGPRDTASCSRVTRRSRPYLSRQRAKESRHVGASGPLKSTFPKLSRLRRRALLPKVKTKTKVYERSHLTLYNHFTLYYNFFGQRWFKLRKVCVRARARVYIYVTLCSDCDSSVGIQNT